MSSSPASNINFVSSNNLRLMSVYILLLVAKQSHQTEAEDLSQVLLPNGCNDTCGVLSIPYPFRLSNAKINATCGYLTLSCYNSSAVLLPFGSKSYRVLEFFHDGIVVESFPNSTISLNYIDDDLLNSYSSLGLSFGVSEDNMVRLYDCEDSSICSRCGNNETRESCCYAMWDHAAVQVVEDGLSFFSRKFGCKGFSSWVRITGKPDKLMRGIKLEWAIPRNSSKAVCANHAYMVNASSIRGGVRCLCQDGFFGDAYAAGLGCFKSSTKDGQETSPKARHYGNHHKRKLLTMAGFTAPVFVIISIMILRFLLRRQVEEAHVGNKEVSWSEACSCQFFAYQELEEATKEFENSQKPGKACNGTMYSGIFKDGSHIMVHKIPVIQGESDPESDLSQLIHSISTRIRALCEIAHRNMASIIGYCFHQCQDHLMLHVVYELPANGSLDQHLSGGEEIRQGLDWFTRLNIVAETANFLAFLEREISPPVYHHNLKSSCIFLEEDFSVKVSGFDIVRTSEHEDVYDLGVLLLQMIAGPHFYNENLVGGHKDLAMVALQQLRSGRLEEIVDPVLNYDEQPLFFKEQIGKVADLATRCMLFGGGGDCKLRMSDVAGEVVELIKQGGGVRKETTTALEETFSNSSLLQMISMSPDSIYC